MKISTTLFEHKGDIPKTYTCDGENVNPPLQISDVPEEAKSLVLIMDDPDSPTGTWVHWLVWNIDPSVTKIEEASVPIGVTEGTTSFGHQEYGGPCPHAGTHRYFFKLYALDTTLDLPPETEKEELVKNMSGHIIAEAEYMGHYTKE